MDSLSPDIQILFINNYIVILPLYVLMILPMFYKEIKSLTSIFCIFFKKNIVISIIGKDKHYIKIKYFNKNIVNTNHILLSIPK